ncbi:TIGR03032 family protein [Nostoc linckia FACHB-104]|nr:TIGR03032 family protein [Nostoc linckia FACHB-104]
MSAAGIELDGSRLLMEWLLEQRISLALTTYQSNRLLLVGVKPEGRLSTVMRTFDRIMGLWATPERLTFTTRHQVWQLANGLEQPDPVHDRLYIPRICHFTGEIDAHDLVIEDSGRIVFVNTLHSCLATVSERYNFTPLWKPPFISKLAPEDRCHLNGLARRDGQARYITLCGRSDVTDGWRDQRQNGGCVMDIQTNEVVLKGLSMPHSPRWYEGKLWLLNSGKGEFGYADLEQGRFEPIAFCPGYSRGLAFWGNYAIVGLSMPRDKSFTGLALDQQLSARQATPRCGLLVIDLKTGDVVHWLRIGGLVTELYDVQVIPGVRHPGALSLSSNEVRHTLVLDPQMGTVVQAQQQAIALDYPAALALQKAGQTAEAIASFTQIVQDFPDHAPSHYQLGRLYQKQQQLVPAIAHYRQALQLQPHLTTAWFNLGVALQTQQQTAEAIACYQQVLKQQPQHLKALNNLGCLLEQEHRREGAIACYRRACLLAPNDSKPLLNLGRLLAAHKEYEAALPHLEKAIALAPDALEILLEYENVRLSLCDWQDYDRRMEHLCDRLQQHYSDPNSEALSGLLNLNYLPISPDLQKIAAQRFARGLSAIAARGLSAVEAKLRLAYLSPDFRDHSVGLLTHALFQHHNRHQFEVYAYSLFPTSDEFTEKIRAGCDAFVNLAGLPAEVAAQRIRDDGIDILIDLAGYTAHSRPDILALQPAPLQIQYLGYPGTMGAEFVPFILADSWLIPPAAEPHYTEQVIHLPHAFVASPLDIAPHCPTRSELGLPEAGIVYCAFHHAAKIDPPVFAAWMRILQQVPGSVLWLSAASDTVKANLRQAAETQGIAPERLIFAPKRPLPDYLAQYQQADLFLDTWVYSAGSTAVCALSAGLPMLTRPGQTYAARMGASILAAAGLEELICPDAATYEQRAVQLGQQPAQLRSLRQTLAHQRSQAPLFDVHKFVHHLEATLSRLWQQRPMGSG